MITDALFTSPILHGDDAGGVGGMPADGSGGMVNDVAAGGLPAGGGQFAQYNDINGVLNGCTFQVHDVRSRPITATVVGI